MGTHRQAHARRNGRRSVGSGPYGQTANRQQRQGGSNKTTFTVVEAELSATASDGLILSSGDEAVLSGNSVNVELGPETTTVGAIDVVGSDVLARDVLTARVRDALQAPETMEAVYAGEATEPLLEAVPNAEGTISGLVTGTMESVIEDRLPGDASTVRTERKGVIRNATELDAQAAAVAAIAESFERATAVEATESGGESRTI